VVEQIESDATDIATSQQTASSYTDDNPFQDTNARTDKDLENIETAAETYLDTVKKSLNKEISAFTTLITSPKFKQTEMSTRKFWRQNKSDFALLFKLSLILNNAHCSAATIERFFSICGVVCKKRSLAMTDDLIIARSLLKTNITLFDIED
jgi:hypothetical protein